MAHLLDGKAVAARIKAEVAEGVSELRERGREARLDVILVGEDPASVTYVRNKQNDSAEVGIESKAHRFDENVSQKELAALVGRLNGGRGRLRILHSVTATRRRSGLSLRSHFPHLDPAKDVDGLSPTSAGRLAVGLPSLLPCTPHGIVQMLGRNGIELAGKEAAVLGRSNLVGKPLAQLMLRENATVTICHSRTKDLPEVARRADVLVAAIGRREMVGGEYVKEGAVVVDVGIHRKEDGGLTGDVKFEEVEKKAAYITPVPGGVGPMTRAMLLYNTLQAARSG